jgi:hypothetical protein
MLTEKLNETLVSMGMEKKVTKSESFLGAGSIRNLKYTAMNNA